MKCHVLDCIAEENGRGCAHSYLCCLYERQPRLQSENGGGTLPADEDSPYQEVPMSDSDSDSGNDPEEPDKQTAAEIRAYAKIMLQVCILQHTSASCKNYFRELKL